MIRVISADDHALVRNGIRQLLSDEIDIDLVAEASNGAELLQLLDAQACEVLLLDVSMPGRDGISLLKTIRDRWPQMAVVMLTMHPEDQYAARALRAGAAGYVTKDAVPDELVRAIRRVASGGRYISPAFAEALADALGQDDSRPLHEKLSDREFRVLCRIGAGKSVSEIAEELFLSVNTVSTYRTRLLAKLGLSSTAELIRYVVTHQLHD
jgi:two-component system, NarL family, invasion response regulator UvrY